MCRDNSECGGESRVQRRQSVYGLLIEKTESSNLLDQSISDQINDTTTWPKTCKPGKERLAFRAGQHRWNRQQANWRGPAPGNERQERLRGVGVWCLVWTFQSMAVSPSKMDPTVWTRRPVNDEIEYLRKVDAVAATSLVLPGTDWSRR